MKIIYPFIVKKLLEIINQILIKQNRAQKGYKKMK